jgi:hypothetical protein
LRLGPLDLGRNGLDEVGRDFLPPCLAFRNVFRRAGQPGDTAAGPLAVASRRVLRGIPSRCRLVAGPGITAVAFPPPPASTTPTSPASPPATVAGLVAVIATIGRRPVVAVVRHTVIATNGLNPFGPARGLPAGLVIERGPAIPRGEALRSAIRLGGRRPTFLTASLGRPPRG